MTLRFGPAHPEVAAAMVAQGALQAEIGDYADGVSTLMRALAATEAATGRHSPAVAAVLVALADAHAGAGARSDLAAPLLERALGICELALGPEVGGFYDQTVMR